MKKFLLLLSIIALSFWRAGECEAQNSNPLPGSDYKSAVRFGEDSVTMQSRLGTHILVIVSINDSPVEMALDTGASYSLISLPAAKELKLKSKKGNYVGCRSNEYTEAKIQIGKIAVENQRLCSILQYGTDARIAGNQVKVPGIFGYDFLRNFVVEVDYSQNVVRLHKPDAFKYIPDKSYVGEVPFRLVNGTPHIDVTLVFRDESRQKIDALVDTGSWLPVMVTDSLFEAVTRKNPYSWEFGRGWILNVPSVNEYQPSNLAGPTNFDAVLGNPALARYKLYFDYPRGRIILSDNLIR
jgi:predicted aspartyl protease